MTALTKFVPQSLPHNWQQIERTCKRYHRRRQLVPCKHCVDQSMDILWHRQAVVARERRAQHAHTTGSLELTELINRIKNQGITVEIQYYSCTVGRIAIPIGGLSHNFKQLSKSYIIRLRKPHTHFSRSLGTNKTQTSEFALQVPGGGFTRW